ncbi:nitrate reductase molybdenum cofactor assembly chaperone [Orrella marina]|uniref:Nitrate reductase molybdenum cofactor assembly chaperone n=1 Tax=Orrella marina TaxID=2163011 RepID=A0A2R4XN69_9BURK|nr:nitrate reductase molybdenum cofactor assembly chaperone [Orrella marina]AWB35221.1 nitrate reductase molybdenum cofactor assembly chaperone [Orrella marina]
MKRFNHATKAVGHTLRVLAHLLRYPDTAVREHSQELIDALAQEGALSQSRQQELRRVITRLASGPSMLIEAEYVETFDRGRQTSLFLFEHVHGDSRDRGPAMIDLIQTYEQAGLLLAPHELPDYLPVVLEFASTQPAQQARAFLGETVHIAQAIFTALANRHSPYASVLAAIIELAGEQARAVEIAQDDGLDDSWAEPAAFDGCSTKGQARPGQPQPIHIVRRTESLSPSSHTPNPGAQA